MAGQNHSAWDEYAREQTAVRLRETRGRADVTGQEALDRILNAVGEGRSLSSGEAQRARTSSERRERAHDALRARHATGYEDDLRSRVYCAESLALTFATLRRVPERTARVLVLDAQGFDGREVARKTGIGEAAARQCLSRAMRRLSA